MHVLVLQGGVSPEREVSLRSAAAVTLALGQLGYQVTTLDPKVAPIEQIVEAALQADVTLPILHGEGGEDGVIQAALEAAGATFFGSGSAACALTYDKVAFKKALEAGGIRTPRSEVLDTASFETSHLRDVPFVLKPINGGSSIDTFIVREQPGPVGAMQAALGRYGTMLCEELIDGAEITVGVVGDEPLPVIEIIPPEGAEFDYENKYNGVTQELCPPQHVSEEVQERAKALALRVHRLTRCRHVSRTDMLIGADGELFVIDTNTIPGMTEQSLLPKAAAEHGLTWTQLVNRFVEMPLQ